MQSDDEVLPVRPPDSPGLALEDWREGLVFRTTARRIEARDVADFIRIAGLLERIETPLDYGGNDGARPVAVPLVFALAEGLLQRAAMQGTGLAFLGAEQQARAPVFEAERIHVTCEVLSARRTSKGDRGVVISRNRVIRDDGTCALDYRATRMFLSRKAASLQGGKA